MQLGRVVVVVGEGFNRCIVYQTYLSLENYQARGKYKCLSQSTCSVHSTSKLDAKHIYSLPKNWQFL